MLRCCLCTRLFETLKSRGPELYQIGQAHGEGLSEHPTAEDEYESAFSLARQFKLLPSQILDMDGELYFLFIDYLNGYARGQEVKNG